MLILEEKEGIVTPTMERGREGDKPSIPLRLKKKHYGVIEMTGETLKEGVKKMREDKEKKGDAEYGKRRNAMGNKRSPEQVYSVRPPHEGLLWARGMV